MALQTPLDFGRIDVLSTSNDQITNTRRDEQEAVLKTSIVFRPEPTFAIEHTAVLRVRAPIAEHHNRTFDADHTHFTFGRPRTILPLDADVDRRQWRANAVRVHLEKKVWGVTHQSPAFGHAVA